jgi:hypothetical protein
MDCGICYFTFSDSEFFQLTCCKNNNVCRQCINLLTTALCPFCRARIPSLPDKRLAISYQENVSPAYSPNFRINPLDDNFLDSRILRRQMKRIRKLQERERDQLRNRQLVQFYKDSKRQEIQRQIKEEKEIYDEEQFEMD